jgi:hypothetical protein
MVATTVDRVAANTAASVNHAIAAQTERNVAFFRDHRDEIPARLAELDREWDVERVLAAAAASVSLGAVLLGFSGRRRWLRLPLLVQGFYLLHTVQGWCPPLPVLRRLGFRTPNEIDRERYTLIDIARDTRPAREPVRRIGDPA